MRPDRRRTWPRSFRNRLASPLPELREALSAVWHGGLRPHVGDADQIPVRRSGLTPVTAFQAMVTWVGHATYLLRIGGLTVLTDPVWSARIPGVRRRRLTPPGVAWSDLPPVDAVLISHNHYDHLDIRTLRRLPRNTPFFVPAGLRRWFARRGFRRVAELDWWERATLGGLSFDFVPAHHWSRRGVFDTCRTLWGGWMISGGGHRIYFAGDTAYGERFLEIGERYPGIDLALMPVGAYESRGFVDETHVDPAQAVQGCLDVGARRMATMHWGTFVLSGEPLLAPVELARRGWAEHARPRADLWDLAIGESRLLR
ncbi:membrane protein [Microtetraspora sp. NBRC 13810]|uniref:MBL fold metallo-hydrolase n=1 Tax=Microtetraspora sp. NBRC 13810 TaxID=3030990 RepID=UPI0024A34C25|nr:MBL fold metallo-hydrolase [Microtetraspora sp. NBRC 13810]GLW07460.1 membrane protein [Microtetraspora sp. NBRC 13810]